VGLGAAVVRFLDWPKPDAKFTNKEETTATHTATLRRLNPEA
jgi:hypothetical protein